MSKRIALDANAVIAFLRPRRPPSAEVLDADEVFLPLPVVGELFVGAYLSSQQPRNVAAVEEALQVCTVLGPDVETARVYGRLRAQLNIATTPKAAYLNDLWIAALCLQHDLPLLTNDRGFDSIPNLTTIHW